MRATIRALGLGFAPALFLTALACLALSPAAGKPGKDAADAVATRAESPRIIARDPAKKEARPAPLIGDFPARVLRAPPDPRAPRNACEHSRSDRCGELADRYFVDQTVGGPLRMNGLAS